MPAAAEVVCDASVVLKWFHAEGEDEVAESRALLDLQASGTIALLVLDLTAYEVGNALVRGVGAPASAAQAVLEALALVCPPVTPNAIEVAAALLLAERHGLTLYDAAYAAVAHSRDARLATMDRRLLGAGLGIRPSEILRGRPT
jgi:predicted nucleic acid-binding protein